MRKSIYIRQKCAVIRTDDDDVLGIPISPYVCNTKERHDKDRSWKKAQTHKLKHANSNTPPQTCQVKHAKSRSPNKHTKNSNAPTKSLLKYASRNMPSQTACQVEHSKSNSIPNQTNQIKPAVSLKANSLNGERRYDEATVQRIRAERLYS